MPPVKTKAGQKEKPHAKDEASEKGLTKKFPQ